MRITLAHRLGEGHPVTRAEVIRDLFGDPDDHAASLAEQQAIPPLAVSFVEPVTPDVSPDAAPDDAVSFTDAAARLGMRVATVRRYCAASSGKLVRRGQGVSLASVERLAG